MGELPVLPGGFSGKTSRLSREIFLMEKIGQALLLILSENTRRGIGLLGQVPPIPTLCFVRKSREKAKVSCKILSENLFEGKVGKRDD